MAHVDGYKSSTEWIVRRFISDLSWSEHSAETQLYYAKRDREITQLKSGAIVQAASIFATMVLLSPDPSESVFKLMVKGIFGSQLIDSLIASAASGYFDYPGAIAYYTEKLVEHFQKSRPAHSHHCPRSRGTGALG